ncbi:MAG: O-antigen ligase family protein [Pyrinomonadaceae bacterium]
MKNFLERFDSLADIKTENIFARWLERASFVFIILMFVSEPHSIAATQIAWLTGMFLWVVRLFLKLRPRLVRTPLDVALWAFFGWSVITSIFSYAPDISIDRLRGTLLFLIFYYVVNVVRTKRAAIFLASAMIFSCMVNVVWTPIQRLIGRGVEIHGVAPDSPLTKARLMEGDALLEANGVKLKTPDDLIAQIERNEITKVKFYRPDFDFIVDVRRDDLLGGENALERLGIDGWKRSRNWRSTGFYSHYVTYSEVLQLIASLVFGLFIASLGNKFLSRKQRSAEESNQSEQQIVVAPTRRFAASLLAVCLAGMLLALLLTVTRSSELGFLISAVAVVIANGNRRLLLGLAVIILPLAIGGLIFLQQSRHVGMFDQKDDSTLYRETMYQDGVRLWTSSPRHFFIGVGMDSVQRYWRDWNLYDGGKLPMGHFHSTPLQLLVERGLPALLIWLWILWIYARTLLRYLKFQIADSKIDWREKGIVLGSFGGMIGFFTSGLVQYNLGDAEVAMAFFMLMGLSLSITRFQITNVFTSDSIRSL